MQVIVSLFTIMGMVIACLGLFGLTSFSVEQRKKEIGIRKVLGSANHKIVYLLVKDFLILVLIANIVALPAGWLSMNKWLQNFAYRTNMSIWIFLLSGFTALAIALLTVSFQIIKAATANPVDSLRYE